MEGRSVEIFLQTPLFRFRYVHEGIEKELMDGAVRLRGKILAEKAGGVLVSVEAISNLKVTESELPFKQVFIPFSKIDYMMLL